jgi:WD40 repeat protein
MRNNGLFTNPSSSNLETTARVNVKLSMNSVHREHTSPIFSSCTSRYSNDILKVFSGDSHGNISCFNFVNDKLAKTKSIKTGSEPCWSLSVIEPNLLITSSPNKIKVFDLNNVSERSSEQFLYSNNRTFFGQLKAINDNSFIVNTFFGETLKNEFLIYDLYQQNEIARIPSKRSFSNCFAYVPQNHTIYSANEDKTVSLYDLRGREQTQEFFAHSDAVTTIDICYEKNLFVTGGADGSIRLWDLRNLRIFDEINLHRKKNDDSIFEVKFDPSSKMIASAGADCALKIFHF